MQIDWSPFVALVRDAQRFVLTSHIRPDCDSLGSQLGMAAVLEQQGKDVCIVNADSVPPHVAFIDPQRRILQLGTASADGVVTAGEIADADVLMVLDTSAWGQLGAMANVLRSSGSNKVIVDHHVSADDLGAIEFKNTQAGATGELVVQAADALGVELTAEMAMPLFAAVATDTGWFRFSSVQPETLQIAARLVAAGAEPPQIYRLLYEQQSAPKLRLRGRILADLQVDVQGRLAYAVVRTADIAALGAELSDTEDVINEMLRIRGVEVAVLFVELPEGNAKASLRSRGQVDVRAIAEQFGGGGHVAAAGVTFDGPLAAAQQAILDATRAAMK